MATASTGRIIPKRLAAQRATAASGSATRTSRSFTTWFLWEPRSTSISLEPMEPVLIEEPPREEEAGFVFRQPRPALLVTILLVAVASLGAFQFRDSISPFSVRPFGKYLANALPAAEPSAGAFGTSGGVLLRFAMPGAHIEFPLAVHGDPSGLHYQWIRVGETVPTETPRALLGADVRVPMKAGFYRLVLVKGDQSRTVDGLTLAVLVPFKEKEGKMLNGYRIGTYLAEKIAGMQEPPEGFLEINEHDLDIPVSKHLRV